MAIEPVVVEDPLNGSERKRIETHRLGEVIRPSILDAHALADIAKIVGWGVNNSGGTR